MLTLIGIVLVFAAVFGGYALEKGNPYVLMQPAEMLIICGRPWEPSWWPIRLR